MEMDNALRCVVIVVALSLGCSSDEVSAEGECPERVWSGPDVPVPELVLASLADVEALPPYTRIDGTLRIQDVAGLENLDFLSCLTEIRGGLAIARNPDLVSLDGLEGLRTIASPRIENDFVSIEQNPSLTEVGGLGQVEGTARLIIHDNDSLVSIDGLGRFRELDELTISANDSLETIGLRELQSVGEVHVGALSCSSWDPETEPAPAPVADGNAALTEIDGFDGLMEYSRLEVLGNSNLSSLTKLSSKLEGAAGTFTTIQLNESLAHQAILDASLPGMLSSCGNLDDPTPCECMELPPLP